MRCCCPQRPGHGATGGSYLEDQGVCGAPDYVRSGQATADSIAAAIDFMVTQPFIRPSGVVVVGNSAGGWGALALASRNPANVAVIVNVSGGRGGRNNGQPNRNCAPDQLVAVAGTFGSTARGPTVWLYAANDTYFPTDLSKRMVDAYTAAGGSGEGHALINASSATWGTYLDDALPR
jgi:pimeloyl-ACP methyl ester carboxylesterase